MNVYFLWKMIKDKRYTVVKNLIDSGHITSFRQIFDILPKSVVYKDLGMNNARFTNLMENVELFMVNDLFRIADLIGSEKMQILQMIMNQWQLDQKKKVAEKKGSR